MRARFRVLEFAVWTCLVDSRRQIECQDLQHAFRWDPSLLTDIPYVLIAKCAPQLIAVHRLVFPGADPRLDVVIQASGTQLLDKAREIAEAAAFQHVKEGRRGRAGRTARPAELNLLRLGLLHLRLGRLSRGFLLLHGLVQRTGNHIKDTTHSTPAFGCLWDKERSMAAVQNSADLAEEDNRRPIEGFKFAGIELSLWFSK